MSINITMPALSPTMEEGKLAKWPVSYTHLDVYKGQAPTPSVPAPLPPIGTT